MTPDLDRPLASKFLSGGKLPKILKTIELVRRLRSARAHKQRRSPLVDPDYEINLKDQNLFQRIIEMRIEVEALLDSGNAGDRVGYLESLSGALKATASSTSYGVLVEINTERRAKPRGATIYDADGGHRKSVQKIEKPGTYFAGPIGTFIPAAGRLLLAIAEAKAVEKGISYLFCDTDSMCFARPAQMDRESFRREVKEITDWFTALSPYYERDGRQLDILRFLSWPAVRTAIDLYEAGGLAAIKPKDRGKKAGKAGNFRLIKRLTFKS